MNAVIRFAAHVAVNQRSSLEALVFFNARQQRVLPGIVDAIEKFGAPEIVVEGDRLRVRLGELSEVQSLFAVDSESGRPLGIAIYLRSDLESITVLHLGIAEEFTAEGSQAQEHLLLRLLAELRRCSRRVKGVRRLELFYLAGRKGTRGRNVTRKMAV
jgi:hypothetical protein